MDFLSVWFVLPAFFGVSVLIGFVGAIIDFWMTDPVDVRTDIHRNRAIEAYYCGAPPTIDELKAQSEHQDRIGHDARIESWDWVINQN